MATVTRTTTWSDNQVLTASALNGEFNNLLNALALVNADISAGAAITESKILFSGTGHAHTGGTGGALISSLSGTITGTYTLGGTPTLTKPTVNGSIQALTTDTDGATVTFDLSASNIHTVVLGGNRTLALSNVSVGQAFVIRLVQDGTGSRTVTWFTTIKWVAGVTPTLTTTINKTDVFGFLCTSTGNYDGFIVGQNL